MGREPPSPLSQTEESTHSSADLHEGAILCGCPGAEQGHRNPPPAQWNCCPTTHHLRPSLKELHTLKELDRGHPSGGQHVNHCQSLCELTVGDHTSPCAVLQTPWGSQREKSGISVWLRALNRSEQVITPLFSLTHHLCNWEERQAHSPSETESIHRATKVTKSSQCDL